jgi:hypothetical protein
MQGKEDVDSHPGDAEARVSDPVSEALASTNQPSASRPEAQMAAQMPAAAAPGQACQLSQAAQALRERLEHMVFGDGQRPMSSGLGAALETPTNAFVVDVRAAAGALWNDREGAIRASVAPALIDEVDLIAYLFADALGRPLLHPDDTNLLGKRVLSRATRAA